MVVLLGPSGCGKTTLLRLLAGLDYPDRGRIFIGDRDVTRVPPRKRGISMVFQSYAVFPHLTSFDNIAFGLRLQKRPAPEIRERVAHAAELLELDGLLERFPAQLSGGQRQRVAVARAIVMEPRVLLMDEPLSNLDALLRLQFRTELKKLVSDLQTTTVYVTHDQLEALSLGDRIAVMRSGEIVQVAASMTVYDRPAARFVGSFIGSPGMNFFRAVIAAGKVPGLGLTAPVADGEDILVGIRAEHIRLGPGEVEADVLVVEPLGSHVLVTVVVSGQRLKVAMPPDFSVMAGTRVRLELQPDKVRWFRASDGNALD